MAATPVEQHKGDEAPVADSSSEQGEWEQPHGRHHPHQKGKVKSVEAEAHVELPPQTAAAIVKQVEFYFSDANLPTDEFLLKHVKKSSHGWVNLNIIARFNRMKMYSTDVHAIAAALRGSDALVVSVDGNAVRRKAPLPEVDAAELGERTVVAENIPQDSRSIDALTKLFSKCGIVKMVRICHPGDIKSVAQVEEVKDAKGLHKQVNHNTIISNQLHALVEYSKPEEAQTACKELNDDGNWRAGLKVRPLVRSKGNDRHNHQPDHQHGHHNHHDSNGNNSQHHNSKQGHKGHHHVENTSASGASGKGGGDKGGEDGVEEAAAPRGQTVIKDAMAEALALAKKATYAASHNAEVVKARRRSTDHRRSLDRHHHHGNHQDHSHRSNDQAGAAAAGTKKIAPAAALDLFATAAPQAEVDVPEVHGPTALLKTAAKHLQDEVISTDSGADTSSGDESGTKKKGKRKPKVDYAKWASGIAVASTADHHAHHGPVMPDGTRGFSMGRGKPLKPPPA